MPVGEHREAVGQPQRPSSLCEAMGWLHTALGITGGSKPSVCSLRTSPPASMAGRNESSRISSNYPTPRLIQVQESIMKQKSLQDTRPPAELEKVANRPESIARLGKASALGLGLKD